LKEKTSIKRYMALYNQPPSMYRGEVQELLRRRGRRRNKQTS